MKQSYLSKLLIPLTVLLGCSIGAIAQPLTPVTYSYITGVQTYSVPAGVYSAAIDMYGAAGGRASTGSLGGNGGRVVCTLAVTPGDILTIYVGSAGQNFSTPSFGGKNGNPDGGGTGGNGNGNGGGGGGSTDIRRNGTQLTNRVVVAGGGGGAGYNCANTGEWGGAGGGTTGGTGAQCSGSQSTSICGTGGTQSGGGSNGTNPALVYTATLGLGASGSATIYTGGGGGGYYGGGCGYYGGGGGGSSFAHPILCTSVSHTQGYSVATGNGSVTITGMCTPPVGGAITGFPSGGICVGDVVQVTNPTGSIAGVWSSSTTSVATITNLGYVVGVGAGTTTLSYTVTYACGTPQTAVFVATVNPQPIISSAPSVCVGSTSVFVGTSNPPSVSGTWSSGDLFRAAIDVNTGQLSGIAAGNAPITYQLPTGCFTSVTATINPLPAAITGTASVCQGLMTTLADGSVGGVWSSSNPIIASLGTMGGVVSGDNPGTSNISYTLPSTGCYVFVPVTVNALPNPFDIQLNPGTGQMCAGGAGINVTTNSSDANTNYQLYRGTTMVGAPLMGSGVSGVDYHAISVAGTYSVLATNAAGCILGSASSAVITVNPLPNSTYNINAGGGYCVGGSGVQITLSNSELDVRYDLYGPGSVTPVYSLSGPIGGGLLDFGYQQLPTGYTSGSYYIQAVDPNNCESRMTGTASVTLNPLPTVYNVTSRNGTTNVSGDGYCQGDVNGVRLGLDFSSSGVDYHLLYNGNRILTVGGLSSSLPFPNQTALGAYTVEAENQATHCVASMAGTANVHYSHEPDAHVVGGGGHYCFGDTGVHVSLDVSDAGVNYQLYRNGSAVGAPVAGTGGTDPLDMRLQSVAGLYTVKGTEAATGCSTLMSQNTSVIIDSLPRAYNVTATNGGNFCTGAAGQHINLDHSEPTVNYQLFQGLTGGVTVAGDGNALDFGIYNIVGGYTVKATSQSATACKSTMSGMAVITENFLPTTYPLTGGGDYCSGSAAPHIGVSFSNIGIEYQLYMDGNPVGSRLLGSSSSLDFGAQPSTGTYTVDGINTATGCSSTMSTTLLINEKTPPAIQTVTSNGSAYCAGDTGIIVTLTSSENGIDYQLYSNGTALGSALSGTGSDISFGLQTLSGVYTVVGSNGANQCDMIMNGSATVTIDALPLSYTVSGDGSFCAGGSGVHVTLGNSVAGVSYQLYNLGAPSGPAMSGTGNALDFGAQTDGGFYTVMATDNFTTCRKEMDGNATIIVNPLPDDHAVSGGGIYCTGGSGFHINMSGSQAGISYQLYNGLASVGGSITGNSLSQDFGIQTAAGTYKIIGTDQATTCSVEMSGTPSITVLPLPDVYTSYGGGSYCVGGSGHHINLGGSAPGVNYQLYRGGTAVGIPMAGTGTYLDFGAHTAAGNYSIVATDPTGTCSGTMTGTVAIVINPLPSDYAVTGGGPYCSGGTGSVISINGSTAGVNYQLYNGTTLMTSVMGAGIVRNFAPQTTAGTYHVRATNLATGCSTDMSGTATVSVIPSVTPSVTFSASLGDTVCAGSVNTFTASSVNGGSSPSYQWHVNGSFMGSGASFSYVPGHGDVVKATLTSSEACPMPAIVSNNHLMMVRTYVTPSVTITADHGDIVCKGTPVTYTSARMYEGSTPTYTWLKNSIVAGTGTSYSYVPANGDIVILMLGSTFPCRLADSVYSNNIYMQVDSPTTPVISIVGKTTIAAGESDTLKAIVSFAGASPSYQWMLNGLEIPGATQPVYITNALKHRDSITCRVTTNTSCAAATSFNSMVVSVINVGVKQLASGSDIIVSPNPSNGTFTIKGSLASGVDAEVSYELTSMLGQVVYRGSAMAHDGAISEQVQLSGVASGTYMLNIRSGNERAVFHLVIQ